MSTDPGSPFRWLQTLELRLNSRQTLMRRMDDYYHGRHPLPFLTKAHEPKMHAEFLRLLREANANFMRLVVDATEERIAVEGFRLSSETDGTSDADAWQLWQANDMDSQAQTAVLESLKKGVSYLGVWADDDQDGFADICVEDPLQTIVAYEGGSNYRRRAAALKVWLDENTGIRRANVYMPEGIYKYEAPADLKPVGPATRDEQIRIPWAAIDDGFVPNPLPAALRVVPIIPLRNRPELLVEGESEIADVITVQNQINELIFLMLLAAYSGGHRQRYAVGLPVEYDADGRKVAPFDPVLDKLWQTGNPDVRFGEFSQTDLSGYMKAIDQAVQHIAVTTRTPRHYLYQEGQSPSGDAINSAESGLVRKVQRKQRAFADAFEEAIRLARLYQGETDAPPDSEIVWADAQTHSPATVTDAVVKQYLGRLITHTTALEELGYSQTKIRQILKAPPEEFAPEQQVAAADATVQESDITRAVPPGA